MFKGFLDKHTDYNSSLEAMVSSTLVRGFDIQLETSLDTSLKENVLSLKIDKSNTVLIANDYDTVNLFKLNGFLQEEKNLVPVASAKIKETDFTKTCWYPHDSGMFFSLHKTDTVGVWDTETMQMVHRYALKDELNQMEINSGENGLIAVATNNQGIRLCDLRTLSCLQQLKDCDQRETLSVKWSRINTNAIYCGSVDNILRIWDVRMLKKPPIRFKISEKITGIKRIEVYNHESEMFVVDAEGGIYSNCIFSDSRDYRKIDIGYIALGSSICITEDSECYNNQIIIPRKEDSISIYDTCKRRVEQSIDYCLGEISSTCFRNDMFEFYVGCCLGNIYKFTSFANKVTEE